MNVESKTPRNLQRFAKKTQVFFTKITDRNLGNNFLNKTTFS